MSVVHMARTRYTTIRAAPRMQLNTATGAYNHSVRKCKNRSCIRFCVRTLHMHFRTRGGEGKGAGYLRVLAPQCPHGIYMLLYFFTGSIYIYICINYSTLYQTSKSGREAGRQFLNRRNSDANNPKRVLLPLPFPLLPQETRLTQKGLQQCRATTYSLLGRGGGGGQHDHQPEDPPPDLPFGEDASCSRMADIK